MTNEQLNEASELWLRGETTAEIAAKMGLTKPEMSWVAQKHRDLFPARGANYYRASGFSAENIANRAKAKSAIKPRFPPKAPGFDGVPRGRLASCQCEFPLWGDHERFDLDTSLFCGAPRESQAGGLYCTFHARKASGLGTRSEREAIRVLAAA